MVQPLWKTIWNFLVKIKFINYITYQSLSYIEIQVMLAYVHQETRIGIFIATQFIIIKRKESEHFL